MESDCGRLHPAETDTESVVALALDGPAKHFYEGIGGEVDTIGKTGLLCQVHQVQPDKFIILAQFFSAINYLAVSDHSYFRVLHEETSLITVSTIEKCRTKDLIRHCSLSIRPLWKILRSRREAFKNTFKRINTASIVDRVCVALKSIMLQ